MVTSVRRYSWLVALAASRAVIGGTVVHDGSLGSSRTLTGPNFIIAPGDGRQVGGNLFHSFRTLNLSAGETADFTGPTSVRNVLARVTDGAASEIDGTLRCSIPGANLFFMNPAGAIFGPNARLDVDGAFVVTTADTIKLADGGKFAGDTIASTSVLTSADPSAFGFLKAKPSSVVIVGDLNNAVRAELTTKPQKTLSIVGGEIAVALADVRSPSGRINLISVDSPGEVTGDLVATDAPPPSVDSFVRLGPISLNFFSFLQISGNTPGQLMVRGGTLRMDFQSTAFVSNTDMTDATRPAIDAVLRDRIGIANGAALVSTTSGVGRGGDVRVIARVANLSNADVSGDTTTSISAVTFGSARGGDVDAHFRRLIISGQSDLTAGSSGDGQSGDLTLHAGQVSIDGAGAKLIVANPSFANNRTGNLTVHADVVDITGGGKITSDATTAGQPGGLTLDVTDTLTIRGANSVISVNGPVATAGTGELSITAKRIVIENGARIDTLTFAGNSARSIRIDADELIMRDDGDIQSSTLGDAGGGTIDIRTRALDMRSGSDIFASVFGSGRGGSILIDADAVTLDSVAGISSNTQSDQPGTGTGGSVEIRTRTLDIRGGAVISTATLGAGDAGSVDILATESVRFSGADSGINSPSAPIGAATVGGKGGTIGVVTKLLSIDGGASIRATTATTGAAGDINVSAEEIVLSGTDADGSPSGILSRSRGQFAGAGRGGTINAAAAQVRISDGAAITSAATGPGNSGSVTIRSGDLTLATGGLISASAEVANGGVVSVSALRDLTLNSNARITAAAAQNGGNIFVHAGRSIQLRDSTITAAAGNEGNISIDAPHSVIVLNSTITAQAQGTGGAISIDPRFVVLNKSTINGLAGGQDVLVTINADNLLVSNDSAILTDRGFFAIDTNLAQSLIVFDLNLRSANARLQESCDTRTFGGLSSFTLIGTGGVTPDPARPTPTNDR